MSLFWLLRPLHRRLGRDRRPHGPILEQKGRARQSETVDPLPSHGHSRRLFWPPVPLLVGVCGVRGVHLLLCHTVSLHSCSDSIQPAPPGSSVSLDRGLDVGALVLVLTISLVLGGFTSGGGHRTKPGLSLSHQSFLPCRPALPGPRPWRVRGSRRAEHQDVCSPVGASGGMGASVFPQEGEGGSVGQRADQGVGPSPATAGALVSGGSLLHVRTHGRSGAGLPRPRIVCAAVTTVGGTLVWVPSGSREAEKLQKGARNPNTGRRAPSAWQESEVGPSTVHHQLPSDQHV